MQLSKSCQSITPSAFGLAIQALALLSISDNVCPSQEIAKMMKSGTTFMRRVMGPLVRANLVEAKEGRDGGYSLAKPAHLITVADVYRALQIKDPMGGGLLDSTTNCPNGQHVRTIFNEMANRSEKSTLAIYEQYTIEQIASHSFSH
jgi:Rrf2 family transcriptional regulator, repressor of oqxAB